MEGLAYDPAVAPSHATFESTGPRSRASNRSAFLQRLLLGADLIGAGLGRTGREVLFIDGESIIYVRTGYCDQAKRGRNLNSSNGSTYATNRQGSGTRVLNKHERLKLAIAESNRQLGIGAD